MTKQELETKVLELEKQIAELKKPEIHYHYTYQPSPAQYQPMYQYYPYYTGPYSGAQLGYTSYNQ